MRADYCSLFGMHTEGTVELPLIAVLHELVWHLELLDEVAGGLEVDARAEVASIGQLVGARTQTQWARC